MLLFLLFFGCSDDTFKNKLISESNIQMEIKCNEILSEILQDIDEEPSDYLFEIYSIIKDLKDKLNNVLGKFNREKVNHLSIQIDKINEIMSIETDLSLIEVFDHRTKKHITLEKTILKNIVLTEFAGSL